MTDYKCEGECVRVRTFDGEFTVLDDFVLARTVENLSNVVERVDDDHLGMALDILLHRVARTVALVVAMKCAKQQMAQMGRQYSARQITSNDLTCWTAFSSQSTLHITSDSLWMMASNGPCASRSESRSILMNSQPLSTKWRANSATFIFWPFFSLHQ